MLSPFVITTVFNLPLGIELIADAGIVALSIGQLPNALLPILVTLSPITTLVRLEHILNAYSPMLVTLSGIVMLVRLVQL